MPTTSTAEISWDIVDPVPNQILPKPHKRQSIPVGGITSKIQFCTHLAVMVLAAAGSRSVSVIPHSTNVEPVIERIVSVRADKERPSRWDWQRHSLADTDVGMSSTRLSGMFHVMFSEEVDPDLALGEFTLD